MACQITEIAIHPFREDEDGWYNTGGDGPEDGWNVHAFGDADGEAAILEDENFDDYESAWAFALELSDNYGAEIDHRY